MPVFYFGYFIMDAKKVPLEKGEDLKDTFQYHELKTAWFYQ